MTDNKYARDRPERNTRATVCELYKDMNITVTSHKSGQKKTLTSHKKFRKASMHGMKIAELLSMSSQLHFDRRIEQLEEIVKLWSNKQEFFITPVIDNIGIPKYFIAIITILFTYIE